MACWLDSSVIVQSRTRNLDLHEHEPQSKHVGESDEVLPWSIPSSNHAQPYQRAEVHSEEDDCTGILRENVAIINLRTETGGRGIARAISACRVGRTGAELTNSLVVGYRRL